jgi:putative ABC transport system permease protein
MTRWGQDLRYAWRSLRRAPGFAVAAVLTLTLGIGANTAFLSLADAALLRPLPYPAADRLVMLWERNRAAGKERERVSAANFLDWRREATRLDQIAAWVPWGYALTGSGEPEELSAIRASAGLFRVLGAAPAMGRGFVAEDEIEGRNRVVVVSHGFWTARLGSEPLAVGRTLTLDREPYQIIGVMPAGFRFPGDASVAFWTPLAFDASELVTRAERRFNVIGRLVPGASFAEAAAEMDLLAGRLAKAHPETNAGWSIEAMPAVDAVASGGRAAVVLLVGTVALVLVLACANVAHLSLARGLDRERELVVRSALGGSATRLLRLLILESCILVAIGALVGVGLAGWAVPLVQTLDPGLLSGWRAATLDVRVLLLTAALLAPITLLCGVLPAIRVVGFEGRISLAGEGARFAGRRDRGRVRQALIVAETAVSMVLLVGAGLHLRSLIRLQQVDPGFDGERVVAATVFLSGVEESSDDAERGFFTRVLDDLTGRPGILRAGAVTTLPMNPVGIDYDLPFSPDGNPPPSGAERQEVDFRVVAGAYFEAIGVPVIQGRAFGATDREGSASVVIVNRTLADRYFPGTSPVGRRVWAGGRIGAATVVGVVGDVRHRTLAARPRPELYVPFRQHPHGGMTIVALASGEPVTAATAVKDAIQAVSPSQPISSLTTLSELVHASTSPQRFTLALLGGFAGLALGLAAVGVYGVIAYAVGRRTREIGIRMALGAAAGDVRSAVVRPTVGLAGAGVALGSTGAWILSRLLAPDLFETSVHDPITYAAVAMLLLVSAWAACAIPARRAARVDPATCLRSE